MLEAWFHGKFTCLIHTNIVTPHGKSPKTNEQTKAMKVMVNFQLGKLNVKDEIINNDTSVGRCLSHGRVIVDYVIFQTKANSRYFNCFRFFQIVQLVKLSRS